MMPLVSMHGLMTSTSPQKCQSCWCLDHVPHSAPNHVEPPRPTRPTAPNTMDNATGLSEKQGPPIPSPIPWDIYTYIYIYIQNYPSCQTRPGMVFFDPNRHQIQLTLDQALLPRLARHLAHSQPHSLTITYHGWPSYQMVGKLHSQLRTAPHCSWGIFVGHMGTPSSDSLPPNHWIAM